MTIKQYIQHFVKVIIVVITFLQTAEICLAQLPKETETEKTERMK